MAASPDAEQRSKGGLRLGAECRRAEPSQRTGAAAAAEPPPAGELPSFLGPPGQCGAEDYCSDYDEPGGESGAAVKRRRREDGELKATAGGRAGSSFQSVAVSRGDMHRSAAEAARDKFDRARWMQTRIAGLSAYEKHVRYINNFVLFYGDGEEYRRQQAAKIPRPRNDFDVLQENHRFVWSEADRVEADWEQEQAFKYYQKLHKEYCLVDLSRAREGGAVAMRWRVDREVREGKGQFSCGELSCTKRSKLASWEVNFGYVEHGTKRNTLVKVRLCPKHSKRLNKHRPRKQVADSADEGLTEK